MLLNHTYLPIAVLCILAEQGTRRGARIIPRTNARRLPQFRTSTHQTQAQVVILVAHQFLIKAANLFQRRLPPAAKVNRIDLTFVIDRVRTGTTRGKRRLKCQRDGLLPIIASRGPPGSADIGRARLLQHLNTLSHVIWRVFRVRVHANENVATRHTYGSIQPRRHKMPRVVNQTHTLIAVRQLVYLFARTVVAHTIRDDDLESEGGIILSQHGLQTWNDRSRFVAYRHDDAYEVVCDGPGARGRRGCTHGSRTATHICVELSSSGEKPAKSQ